MKNSHLKNNYYSLSVLDGIELLSANSCKLNFPLHKHNTINISLILKNTFITNLANKKLQAPVGAISITNSDEVHATPCDNNFGNSFFTYYISPDLAKDLNKKNNVFFDDRVIYDAQIFNELHFLSRCFNNDEIQFEKRLKIVLTKLFNEYASTTDLKDTIDTKLQDIVNHTPMEIFSLGTVASQLGISKFKFIRLFKKETGLTPQNYILLKRIEQSKKLLKDGNSIFDVGIDCGFYDNSHFYKNFKRFTGVNPLEFQKAFLST